MRLFKLRNKFVPMETYPGDEIFPNGIFEFNISKMTDYIKEFGEEISIDSINVSQFRCKSFSDIDENHVDSVDISIPIILAEISPNSFNVIDGHHRLEKAYRNGVDEIMAYKLTPEQFIPFLTTLKGYKAFIEYWNSKLKIDKLKYVISTPIG